MVGEMSLNGTMEILGRILVKKWDKASSFMRKK
jgi:hypothetical protein